MRTSSVLAGLYQALGLTAYVVAFVVLANIVPGFIGPTNGPFLGMLTVLLAFVTSALICSAITLGYPAYLFFSDEKLKAVKVVVWTAGWMVVILAVVFMLIPSAGAFRLN